MAFSSGVVTVGAASPVQICVIAPGGVVTVKNPGKDTAFLGGPGVTAATGYPLLQDESQQFFGPVPRDSPLVPAPGVQAGAALYAIAAAGQSTTVAWIGS
jgi:hypothetical protein